MTRIRLRSRRDAALAALSANPRAAAALTFALSVAGCTFDVTPTASATGERSAAAGRQATSSGRQRDGGGTEQQMRAATAEGQVDSQSPTDDTTADGGMPSREPDAGQSSVDAGRTTQPAARRDAGQAPPNAAGSAAPMGMPDASAPDQQRPDTSRCMPGIYEGDFEGPVTFVVGSIDRVTGTMRAEAVLDASGDSLRIVGGVITGMDNFGVGMSATWTGSVSCTTSQLTDGRLADGAWDNGSTFTGTLEGTYAVSPHAMSGTWQVESREIPLAGGNGEWQMTLRGSSAP